MSEIVMNKKRIRKTNQTDNSLSVDLPEKIADMLNIKNEADMLFEWKDAEALFNKEIHWDDHVDIELLDMLTETFEEHHHVFENLKDR